MSRKKCKNDAPKRASGIFSHSCAGGNSEDPIHIFQIQPPFVFKFRLPVPQEVIAPNSEPPGHRDVSHHPLNKSMKRREGFVPRTNGHAHAAACPYLVTYPHAGTLLHIQRPALIAISKDLILKTYRPRGALPGTFLTFGAEIL